MVRCRLSGDIKSMLKNNTKVPPLSKKLSGYLYSNEFYKDHPDLMPRDIYLASGRVITREEIDKEFAKMTKEPFLTCVKNFINKIFKKEK